LAITCPGRNRALSVPPEKAELDLGSTRHLLYDAPRESGAEKEKKCMYQNRVSIIGFVGSDAQLRPTKNGAAVAVFSVATTSSWKNA